MPQIPPRSELDTHDVHNQPEARHDIDYWGGDIALREHAALAGGDAAVLADYGALMWQADMRVTGCQTNRHVPELIQFDTGGRRLDEVEFHPSYHR